MVSIFDLARSSRLPDRAHYAELIPKVAACVMLVSACSIVTPLAARAQSLDSLLRAAEASHPSVRGARAHLDAARLRISPAGARPDPTFMAGVQNLPISSPSFTRDEMTMTMVGIGITIPAPGKLALRTRAARGDAQVASAAVESAARDVERDVRDGYYDAVAASELFQLASQSQSLVAASLRPANARYVSGAGSQSDILAARVSATRLAADGVAFAEDRRAALSRLAAAAGLDRVSEPREGWSWPDRVLRAALGDTTRAPTFTDSTLSARVAASPIPSQDSLLAFATSHNPELLMQDAMINAASARAALAEHATRPDVDLAVQYGARAGRADMVSATVSVPLPLQHRTKQESETAAARADVEALHAEHQAQLVALRRDIDRFSDALERDRTQLAMYRSAIIPQARATVAVALASYSANRASLASLVDAETAALAYQTQYVRTLLDFAKTLADLERLIGAEVVP